MKLNVSALEELMNKQFNGNYTHLGKAIGVDPSYVHRVLTKGKGCGTKFFSGLIDWCSKNGQDYNNYIFFCAEH